MKKIACILLLSSLSYVYSDDYISNLHLLVYKSAFKETDQENVSSKDTAWKDNGDFLKSIYKNSDYILLSKEKIVLLDGTDYTGFLTNQKLNKEFVSGVDKNQIAEYKIYSNKNNYTFLISHTVYDPFSKNENESYSLDYGYRTSNDLKNIL